MPKRDFNSYADATERFFLAPRKTEMPDVQYPLQGEGNIDCIMTGKPAAIKKDQGHPAYQIFDRLNFINFSYTLDKDGAEGQELGNFVKGAELPSLLYRLVHYFPLSANVHWATTKRSYLVKEGVN